MKTIFILLMLGSMGNSHADTITLNDGTRLEGTIEGEMDGITLIKTKYGALNIKKTDISSITKPETAVTPETAPQPPLPAEPKPEPERIFKTVIISTSETQRIYFEAGVVIATQTTDAKGELVKLEGNLKDGMYKEYFENGNTKTELTIINAKNSGPMKAYYTTGIMQSEAFYRDGKLNGSVRVYNEEAKILFEQNFLNGIPNGYFREFNDKGEIKSELFYDNGHISEKPKITAEKTAELPATANDSMVTAKVQELARGNRYVFYINSKYIAKLMLDKNFNILDKSGKIPDGAVKAYTGEGKLEKEFIFKKNEAQSLKTYNEDGVQTGEYTYIKNKATRK